MRINLLMKRPLIYLSVLFNVFVLSQLPAFAAPSAIMQGADAAAGTNYNQNILLSTVIGKAISSLLGMIGIVFIIIIIYAGILYMLSAGAEDKVKTAKKMIVQAIVGIIIIVGAYAITDFVMTQLAATVS